MRYPGYSTKSSIKYNLKPFNIKQDGIFYEGEISVIEQTKKFLESRKIKKK